MARDERKRQKNLAKKKLRENRIRKQANIQRNPTATDIVNSMLKGSWYKCYEMRSAGMSNMICIRRSSSGFSACTFLVDSYCLGIKNAMVLRVVDPHVVAGRAGEQNMVAISPEYALKKLQSARDGAKRIGFEPHPKAETAMRIFDDVNAEDCIETFEFGLDGKPYYMSGPYDDQATISLVLNKLSALGKGNYDFTIGAAGVTHFKIAASELDVEDLDIDDDANVVEAERVTYMSNS